MKKTVKNTKTATGQKTAQRKQAEKLSPENSVQTPEQYNQTLHELRVHQIELEMQNEELRTAHAELDATRARYFDLYDQAPVGYVTVSKEGLIIEANLTCANLLGVARGKLVHQLFTRFILKEDQNIYYPHLKKLWETRELQACELRMVKKDGMSFWARLSITAVQDIPTASEQKGAPTCRITLSDITDRKLAADERELTLRLILLVNTPGNFRERMMDITASLQKWSGCEAVGIRLRTGDDYPYCETLGFPPAFVQEEKHLCDYDTNGEIIRDEAGNSLLACMCGHVLAGQCNSALPCFTAGGSFWSNNTSALLANSTNKERRVFSRGRCISLGYESVALIPLRIGEDVFGLLQFNDHRTDRFTPGLIEHLERMADNMTIALSRRQTEEELKASEERYRGVFTETPDGIIVHNNDGLILDANEAMARRLEVPCSSLPGHHLAEFITQENITDLSKNVQSTITKDSHVFETTYVSASGKKISAEVHERRITWNNEQAVLSVSRDITQRKQAEEELGKVRDYNEIIVQAAPTFFVTITPEGKTLMMNQTMLSALGYSLDEVVGKDYLTTFVPESDRELVAKTFQSLVKIRKPTLNNNFILTKQGKQILVEWHGRFIFNKNEEPDFFFGLGIDITERQQAEEALQLSEKKYRSIFDNTVAGLFKTASNGLLVEANESFAHIYGYDSAQEMLAASLLNPDYISTKLYANPEDRQEVLLLLSAKGKIENYETRHIKRDGTIIWVSLTAQVIRDADGSVIFYEGAINDINDRKSAEEELRKSEERFKQLADLFPETIYEASIEGNITYSNEHGLKMFGYTREDIASGVNVLNLVTPAQRNLAIEGMNDVRHGIDKGYYEYQALRKDGSTFTGLFLTAILMTDGTPVGMRGLVIDITERKLAEEKLQKSEEKFRAMIANISDVIGILDADGGLKYRSPNIERLFGWLPEDNLGTDGWFQIHPDDLERAREAWLSCVTNDKSTRSLEYRYLCKDGSYKVIETTVTNLLNDPVINGVLINFHDINARKLAEDDLKKYREQLEDMVRERTLKLEASNKELEAFSYSVSHDLRAPIRTIDGFSRALLEDCADKLDIAGKDHLRRIIMATQRMMALIEDLIKLSRITRSEINIVKVNLTQMAQSIITELQNSQPQRIVNCKIAAGLADQADTRLIRIVLENMLENSWKFTEKQPDAVIEFGSILQEGKTVYFIRDNGAGFDMSFADKLFIPFQRLHNVDEYQGTGIGLATVRRIIFRHGGNIWAEGKVNKGATFYFNLHK